MTISRIIHQTWKNNQVPAVWRPLAASWRHFFPDWQYRLWTDADNRDLVATDYPWFLLHYDAYPENIMRADAARYFILHRFGGIYADLDYECLRRFDDLLVGGEMLLGSEPASHVSWWAHARGFELIICNAFMASARRHPFWQHLFRNLIDSRKKDNALEATGPFLLTKAFEDYQHQERLTLLESHLIYPLDKEECWSGGQDDPAVRDRISDKAIGIHHWDGTWWRPPEDLRESLRDND